VASCLRAAPPQYDHVVIVIEENHSEGGIIGNANADYINQLANTGVNFTNFFAIAHPSQPNYLQLFSGSNQGVTGDGFPSVNPFPSANLGDSLRDAGFSFGGYSQGLPSTGSNLETSGNYARKHNPWVNWQNTPATGTQLPTSTNMPFDGFFPTAANGNFAALPTVSFVVPDLQNDMHDGTVLQGDTWLKNNLKSYIDWAPTHNSLFILTFDEDEGAQNNKIPTIFSGAKLKSGAYSTNWNLHNLLRTVENMYSIAHSGSAANVAPIQGPFVTDGPVRPVDRSFQHGVSTYASGHDTYIESANPNTTRGATTPMYADGDADPAGNGNVSQGLIRFDALVGNAAGQIPANTAIAFAKLTIFTVTTDSSGDPMSLHRMLIPWSDSTTAGVGSTWSSLTAGVSTNDIEAASIPDNTLTPATAGLGITFDVTATVQAWINGATNNGWLVQAAQTDGWRFNSDEFGTATLRPLLEVTFVPEPASCCVLFGALAMLRRRHLPV
jgi:hypothetical protein